MIIYDFKYRSTADVDDLIGADVGTVLSALGLVIGTDVQAYSAKLDELSDLSVSSAELTELRLSTKVQNVNASGSLSINMTLGWHVNLVVQGNITSFAITNVPTSGLLGKLCLDVTNTGAYSISQWPSNVIWPDGSEPQITASGKDTIILTTFDGGSNWRGFVAGQGMA